MKIDIILKLKQNLFSKVIWSSTFNVLAKLQSYEKHSDKTHAYNIVFSAHSLPKVKSMMWNYDDILSTHFVTIQ